MAKGDKVNGSIKADKRNKVILGLVIAVLAVFAIGYFVYISGFLSKVMAGMKVVQIDEVGNQKTVATASVVETNFHYYQVLQTYNQQGMLQYITDIDAVADEATGKTYRQMVLDLAAQELMNSILVNQVAVANGFEQYSGADRAATLSLQGLASQSGNYGSVDRYLAGMYGAGMSSRLYIDCYSNQIFTNEYEQYVRQFEFIPTQEEVQAAYDANPSVYLRVDFNAYYFAADEDENGIYDFTQAEANAALVSTATDSDSFGALCAQALGDEAELAGFVEGSNPTFCEKYNITYTSSMAPGVSEFLFDEETQPGDFTTITTDAGIFVVMLDARYVDETPTVSYRSLTIYNDAVINNDNPSIDELAAGLVDLQNEANAFVASPMDSLAFYMLVKENSDSINEIIYGGYVDGVVESNFTQYYDAVDAASLDPNAAPKADFGHWLFDESRVHGDTYVYVDPSSQFITIYYFESNVPAWIYTAQNQVITGRVNAWSSSIVGANYNYSIAYDLMKNLGY